LAALGFEVISTEEDGCAFGRKGADDFGINQCETPTSNAHGAFTAESRAMVDAFYDAAMCGGARSKHAPAEHPEYHLGYYAAFIWDLEGNNIEAVHHDRGGSGEITTLQSRLTGGRHRASIQRCGADIEPSD
jgi:hypothetical protein